jgi:hypothetical protein
MNCPSNNITMPQKAVYKPKGNETKRTNYTTILSKSNVDCKPESLGFFCVSKEEEQKITQNEIVINNIFSFVCLYFPLFFILLLLVTTKL